MASALPKKEFNALMDAAEAAYPLTLKVLEYVAAQDGTVTTPMLIEAGVLTGKQVNDVRAVMCLLRWGLLFPCGRTCRWWVSDAGLEKIGTHRRSQ